MAAYWDHHPLAREHFHLLGDHHILGFTFADGFYRRFFLSVIHQPPFSAETYCMIWVRFTLIWDHSYTLTNFRSIHLTLSSYFCSKLTEKWKFLNQWFCRTCVIRNWEVGGRGYKGGGGEGYRFYPSTIVSLIRDSPAQVNLNLWCFM